MRKKTVSIISYSIVCIGILGVLARFFGAYFFHNDGYISLFEDDFYYYVITAKNLALHGHSSFDNFTLTNGYHPLWLLINTFLAFIFQGVKEPFFITTAILACISSVCSFHLLTKIGNKISNDSYYIPLFSALIILSINRMNTTGMEVILAVPIALLWGYFLLVHPFVSKWDNKISFQFGLLSAVLMLSRLDTAWLLLGAFVVFIIQSIQAKKISWHILLWVVIGLTPLWIYFIVNVSIFNSLFPVSGMAKSLAKPGFVFEVAPLKYLLFKNEGISSKLSALFIVSGLIIWLIRFKKQLPEYRWVVGIFLFFPCIFLLWNGFRSPWVSLWWWYQYPNYLGAFFALCLFSTIKFSKLKTFREQYAKLLFSFIAVFGVLYTAYSAYNYNKDVYIYSTNQLAEVQRTSIYNEAKRIKNFIDTNGLKGRFAMGDRAGITAYMIEQPVLQLEGLVADKAMVESIKNEENLNEVLKRHSIDFYITSIGNRLEVSQNGSMTAYEPHFELAGKFSKKMSGAFSNPIYMNVVGTSPTDSLFTYIFDLREAKK
jgi:hypothetical protein